MYAGIRSSRPAHCFKPASCAECCWQSELCHPDGANVPANPTLRSSAIKMLTGESGEARARLPCSGSSCPFLGRPRETHVAFRF